ncbi:MAG: D-2-hydroxyacid dehydrogenase [Candidatus Didemnitutus sp.]|nr:D-2-hydroxyacid dehydrogenase [Candidatus Didemnitutus sp.]
MSVTVWTNHALRPGARELFYDSLARLGCRVVQSQQSSASVLTEGQTDSSLAEADIAYGQPNPADVVANPRLRWVAISTAGYTRYDQAEFRKAMRARGTMVTNASGVFAGPCAEHALAMMMSFTRELPIYVRNMTGAHEWNYGPGRYSIETLTGKTVVVLGYGTIGQRLAELLAPFRCRVIGVRRTPRADENEDAVELVTPAEMPDHLALADHVVNVLPDGVSTQRFCNAAFFAQMRRGAYFYNIGRGATVDQDALVAALTSGQVGGAYLDALDPEPLPPEHPLWTAPNCQITPHLAGGHQGQDESLVRHFTDNLGRYLKREPLHDQII